MLLWCIWLDNSAPFTSKRLCYEHSCILWSCTRRAIVSQLLYNVNLDEVMILTAEGGHEEVVHLCKGLGATDLDSVMLWAASGGQGAGVRKQNGL